MSSLCKLKRIPINNHYLKSCMWMNAYLCMSLLMKNGMYILVWLDDKYSKVHRPIFVKSD